MQSQDVEDTQGDACLPPEGVPFQTSFQPSCGPSVFDSTDLHVDLRLYVVRTPSNSVHHARLFRRGLKVFAGRVKERFADPCQRSILKTWLRRSRDEDWMSKRDSPFTHSQSTTESKLEKPSNPQESNHHQCHQRQSVFGRSGVSKGSCAWCGNNSRGSIWEVQCHGFSHYYGQKKRLGF